MTEVEALREINKVLKGTVTALAEGKILGAIADISLVSGIVEGRIGGLEVKEEEDGGDD